MKMKNKDKKINYKDIVIDGCSLVFGLFFYALCFNLFLTPNDLVVSGFSGIAIVTQKLFGWAPSLFLLCCNFIVLIIGWIFLDWKTTKRNIVGSLLYPLMVSISAPIANFLTPYLITDDFYLTLLFALILYGVSSGIIYRSGYTSGGSDIIMQIISKYWKVSESKAMIFANGLIIVSGMFVFGFAKGIYSFIILYCSTFFIDKIMFGISDSKLFYIYTKEINQVKKLIHEEFESGFTTISSTGGYSHKKGFMIMCAVSNNDYYNLKKRVLEIDPKAFMIIDTCYEVNGGVRRSNIPFL